MKYKIIATDFDDTILTHDKKVTKETREYLIGLKSKGFTIVGVTGRNFNSAKSIGETDIFDYVILNNGCDIYDVKNDKIESIFKLTKSFANEIIDKYRDGSRIIDCCSTSNYYTVSNSPSNISFIININSADEIDEDICRMNIFPSDQSRINEIKAELEVFDNIDTFIMQDSNYPEKWLVIMPKGVNKSTSLELLAKRIGFTLENVIFFGDGLNDIELIKSSGLGVAMGNALDEVKNVSDDITITNEEDGVISYLKNKLEI